MQVYIAFMSKEKLNNPQIVPGNLIYTYDSDDPNRTLGFQMQNKKIAWIPIQIHSTDSESEAEAETGTSTGEIPNGTNTAETEGTENVSRPEKNTDSAGQ